MANIFVVFVLLCAVQWSALGLDDQERSIGVLPGDPVYARDEHGAEQEVCAGRSGSGDCETFYMKICDSNDKINGWRLQMWAGPDKLLQSTTIPWWQSYPRTRYWSTPEYLYAAQDGPWQISFAPNENEHPLEGYLETGVSYRKVNLDTRSTVHWTWTGCYGPRGEVTLYATIWRDQSEPYFGPSGVCFNSSVYIRPEGYPTSTTFPPSTTLEPSSAIWPTSSTGSTSPHSSGAQTTSSTITTTSTSAPINSSAVDQPPATTPVTTTYPSALPSTSPDSSEASSSSTTPGSSAASSSSATLSPMVRTVTQVRKYSDHSSSSVYTTTITPAA